MFSNILSIIGISFEVVLLFNLLIIVHELGHFFAARSRGLVVETFAIWFGKPLWSKTINGIEYRLGSIPAGGFVAIPQLAPMEALEGKTKTAVADLPPVSPWDKAIVAVAGPAASLFLAFIFACIVWQVGRPVGESERTAVIGYVMPDGPAAKAGLQSGDKILAVNGHPVTRISGMGRMSDSVVWNVAISQSPLIPIRFERDGIERTRELEPVIQPRQGWGRKNLRQILIMPEQTPVIASVVPKSPAAQAGLRSGDYVLAANGTKLRSLVALSEILRTTHGEPIILTIRRGLEDTSAKIFAVEVTPQTPVGEKDPRIGIVWDQRGIVTLIHPNPFLQISASIGTMWDTIAAVATPHSEITVQHLSGPVGIMRIYYLLFQSPMGWRLALWFSVVLNVNLALLNLLPFPVLDGGHLLLAFFEWVIRKPIQHRVLEWIQSGFALLLIAFMIYVTFFDVLDLPMIKEKAAATENSAPMNFAAPAEKK
ncbi:MAG: RIP metalloprotease RseP [Chthoniobacterales bacterium]